jgi:hypothetical protein
MTRRLLLCALAMALVAGAAVGVAAASPEPRAATPPPTASFTAVDLAWNVSGTPSTTAVVAPGATVSFGYPDGGYSHNADLGTGPQPTSCAQTAGPSIGRCRRCPPRRPAPAGPARARSRRLARTRSTATCTSS